MRRSPRPSIPARPGTLEPHLGSRSPRSWWGSPWRCSSAWTGPLSRNSDASSASRPRRCSSCVRSLATPRDGGAVWRSSSGHRRSRSLSGSRRTWSKADRFRSGQPQGSCSSPVSRSSSVASPPPLEDAGGGGGPAPPSWWRSRPQWWPSSSARRSPPPTCPGRRSVTTRRASASRITTSRSARTTGSRSPPGTSTPPIGRRSCCCTAPAPPARTSSTTLRCWPGPGSAC